MSDSVQPHRRQPTRLRHPWDSPSKNTGVGCHFLLQCMKVKSGSEVAQSCPTLRNPMDCSLPISSRPWDFPGNSTGVDCYFLLQRIFPTQRSSPALPHRREMLYHLSHQGSQVIYFCFIDYAKVFNCVDHNKLWKILKEMGIPDHLTCLLRNLYAGQEATVRTGHGTTD